MIRVSDCTLRDARHAPGVFIDVDAAERIATELAALGIQELEIGLSNRDPAELALMARINAIGLTVPTSGLFFCLGTRSIDRALGDLVDAGCPHVCISIPTSPLFIDAKLKRSFRATMKLMEKAVRRAVELGLGVAFSGEDAARADIPALRDYIAAGRDAGAARFRFAESVSCIEPRVMASKIEELVAGETLPIEVHCHSGYGLALANSIAAIESGASWVSTTVNGIGERGGNTPLTEVLLYLYRFRRQEEFCLAGLKSLCDAVAELTELPLSRFASIVGDDAFLYELGGQYHAQQAYEDFAPDLVGNARRLVVGRKGDPIALRTLLSEVGVELEIDALAALREELVEHIERTRRPMSRVDLAAWLEERAAGESRTSPSSSATGRPRTDGNRDPDDDSCP